MNGFKHLLFPLALLIISPPLLPHHTHPHTHTHTPSHPHPHTAPNSNLRRTETSEVTLPISCHISFSIYAYYGKRSM